MFRFQRVVANGAGHDYVVGDVHGEFHLLKKLLEQFGFDETKDRLFFLGDMVDRGASSEEVLEWLAKPWVFAIRGNHEQMAISFLAGEADAVSYLKNGGAWFLQMEEADQRRYVEAFERLPIAMEIPFGDAEVGLVHAECLSSWPALLERIHNPSVWTESHTLESALWGRHHIRAYARNPNGPAHVVAGIRLVIVGHSPVSRPAMLGNVYYLDTGAGKGGTLSMVKLCPEDETIEVKTL